MLSRLKSAALFGIEAFEVIIEVDSSPGLPTETIVGLPDTVIKESKNRIKSAIKHSGFKYPIKSYTINLAPAELKKEGPFFDVPIALGILDNTQQIKVPPDALYIGELSLNGDIKPIRGVISICHMALKNGIKRIYIPYDNRKEAGLISTGLDIIPVKSLKELYHIINGKQPSQTYQHPIQKPVKYPWNFLEVKGQLMAKRALEVAASGQHNILFIGPPGSGKTMLLKRLPGILPDMTLTELIETYKLHSLSRKQLSIPSIRNCRPFRNPHHTISYAGMVGGGHTPQPGEISMAHNGVLFLDELPEFPRQVLEVLRQPLEEKTITISRSQFNVQYPAHFMLVAAMNPCPCGFHMDSSKSCICQKSQISKYWKKISGPILDRIDIIVEIPRLQKSDLMEEPTSENPFSSEQMKIRVLEARHIQEQRLSQFHSSVKSNESSLTSSSSPLTNGSMSAKAFQDSVKVSKEIQSFLAGNVEKGILTGRSYEKVLKVARTIADIDQQEEICMAHVLEAFQYRTPRYLDSATNS